MSGPLGLGLGLWTQCGGGGTPTPTPTFAQIGPGDAWTGAAGSGGTAPAESATPLGTLVQDEKFIGGFALAPGAWIHGTGIKVSAVGLPPQDPATDTINYFKEAVFYCEGNTVTVTDWSVNNTPVTLHDGTVAPQGSIGFAAEIIPGTGLAPGNATAGDMVLYCYLRGDHGLERRISIPLVNNVDRSLDPVGIDVTATPSGTTGTLTAPWTGASGTYTGFFSAAASRVSRTVTLTNASTAVTYSSAPPASSSTRIWLKRAKFFVDYTNGSDSNIGNLPGTGNAWKSLLKAEISTLDGALIEVAAGTYVEDSNSGALTTQTRAVEFRPAAGVLPSQIVVTRSARQTLNGGLWNIRMTRGHFFGMTIDLSKIMTINGSGNPCSTRFVGCRLVDPNGPNGPVDANGYDIGYNVTAGAVDGVGVLFPAANGARTYLEECYFENYHILGAYLYRNVTGLYSTDAMATGGGSAETDFYDNVVIDGYYPTSTRSFQQRYHLETELTVATAVYNSGTNRTVITYSGSPTLTAHGLPSTPRPDTACQIVAGTNKGLVAACVGQDNTAKTSTITGDWSALLTAGDKVRSYVIWHSDAFQLQGVIGVGTRGPRNMVATRYDPIGPYTQAFLIQAPGTDFSPAFTTISTGGADDKDVTLGTSQTWRDGDSVRLLAGPQIGEARLMDGDGTATQFGRLKEAYSAPQATPRACMRTKTWDGLAVYSSRFRKTSFTNDPASPGFGGDEFGQFSSGCKNMVIAHITVTGRQTAALSTLGFRNALVTPPTSGSNATGYRNFKMVFSAMGQIYSDTTFPARSEGLYIQRVQFMTGTDPHGAGQVGSATMDPVTNVLSGGALTVGVQPLVPYDLNGNPVTASSPVGGVVQ
jgi:hypothetical protein